jgi:predicted dehydrogenase
MVYDWSSHLLDQILCLFPGKVISVFAHLHYVFSKEVDDNFTILLRFDTGLSALVSVSMNCFITQPHWHICCKDGTVMSHDWDAEGMIVKLSKDAGELSWEEDIVYTAAGPTRTMAPRPKETTSELPLPEVKANWADLYKNVAGAINGTAELMVKPEQVLRVMKIIDAAFESDKIKSSVSCDI